jgi:hypothetical protein
VEREFAVERTMGEAVVDKVQRAFDFAAARPKEESLRGKVLSAIARWGAELLSKEVVS